MGKSEPILTVLESTLRDVVATGVVEAITATGRQGCFEVIVRIGSADRLVAGTRGKPRVFATLTSVATFLGRLGVHRFQVDATEFKPGRVRGPRPDRVEAMRRAGSGSRQRHKSGKQVSRSK